MGAHDPMTLPDDLPVPIDDGAADHLVGMQWPSVALPATDGRSVDVSGLRGRTVVFGYPRTGVPHEDPLVPDWDAIPGARGCTPQACGFRDHHDAIVANGARVLGLSTQNAAYQREAAERLHLPYPLLSDVDLRLASALRLPTFDAAGQTLLRRLTMVVDDGVVIRIWYPVFPPDTHASDLLCWLHSRRTTTSRNH